MKWERISYGRHKLISNWLEGDAAAEVRRLLQSFGRLVNDKTLVARWKEPGYEYITWSGELPGETANIFSYTCYRKKTSVKWFKKERT